MRSPPHEGPEHGFLSVAIEDASDLLRDLPDDVVVFQDHTDEITLLPDGLRVLASSEDCRIQANRGRVATLVGGTQFHSEESTTEHPAGRQALETFFSLVS